MSTISAAEIRWQYFKVQKETINSNTVKHGKTFKDIFRKVIFKAIFNMSSNTMS